MTNFIIAERGIRQLPARFVDLVWWQDDGGHFGRA